MKMLSVMDATIMDITKATVPRPLAQAICTGTPDYGFLIYAVNHKETTDGPPHLGPIGQPIHC